MFSTLLITRQNLLNQEYFKEHFEIKVQGGSILNYPTLRISNSPLGLSVDQTDHITELVNKWFQTGKFRKVDTPLRTDSTYETELMAALTLT